MNQNESHQDVEKSLIDIAKQLLLESGQPYKREIKIDASLQRQLGIDSLARAELFQRIEKKFQVTFPDRLLAEAESLNDIAIYLYSASPNTAKKHKPAVIITHHEHPNVDPTNAKTLLDIVLLYGEQTPDKAHIYFQNEDGNEEIITYGMLLNSSLRVANSLRELGLKEGETVAIMQPTNPGFFYTFFGTLLAGGVPVPIYPPFRMHMLEAYAKTEAKILTNAGVRILVTFDKAETLSRLLKAFVPSLKHVTTVAELLKPTVLHDVFKAKQDNFAFIQYTSGSTSDPKGVLLSHQNLLANIRAYGKAVNVTPESVAVSWLPLYHDMGLIGMWLGSLYFGIPLVLLTPFSFLNRPESWLWAVHYHRGTHSGAPNFAYELCVRKIDPATIEGLDLSSWQVTANGAEKVYPRTLEQFIKKFAPYGFKSTTLMPVYGLAESTVGLTIPPMDRDFLVDHVDRKKFEEDRLSVPTQDKNALEFVSCGLPLEGHEIRIVDDEGSVLEERCVGKLQFRGPSSMRGYYNNPKATNAIYHEGGWIDTGDLAYIANGELYLTGRQKDLIIKAGRNLYPVEIEELVGVIPGIRQGCVTAFGATDSQRGTEQLIVVAETRIKNKTERENIISQINETIATRLDIVPDHVILVTPHTVPKTSSGKLQRAACKKMYLEGKLGQWHVPAWLQVIKLGAQGFMRNILSVLGIGAEMLFTLYVLLISLVTFVPVWIYLLLVSRESAAYVLRGWAKLILKLSFCPVTVIGSENIPSNQSVIFACNHASYLDSVIMLAATPLHTRFVAKKELMSTPILRTIMHKLDYLPVDRMDFSKGIEDTQRIEETLKNGQSIVIFPEGTFGYSAGLRPFRLGAFKIAAETHVPICPVALSGTRHVLRDDEKLMRPGRIKVTFLPIVEPKGKEWNDVTQMRNEVRLEIARHCGEPSLDFIAAETVAPKLPKA